MAGSSSVRLERTISAHALLVTSATSETAATKPTNRKLGRAAGGRDESPSGATENGTVGGGTDCGSVGSGVAGAGPCSVGSLIGARGPTIARAQGPLVRASSRDEKGAADDRRPRYQETPTLGQAF